MSGRYLERSPLPVVCQTVCENGFSASDGIEVGEVGGGIGVVRVGAATSSLQRAL